MVYNDQKKVDDDSPPATALALASTTSNITANFGKTCSGITITTASPP